MGSTRAMLASLPGYRYIISYNGGGIVAQQRIYKDITETMGDTPLIQLNRVGAGLPGRVVVKNEGFNPFNSVKDRIGTAMVDDALRDGSLRPGMFIVEPTSGNTGIGLAYAAVARGFRCVFTMPETMTIERRNMLRALGCRVVLTEGPKGMKGAIARAEQILGKLGNRHFRLRSGNRRDDHRRGSISSGEEARNSNRSGRTGGESRSLWRGAISAQTAGDRRGVRPQHSRHQDLSGSDQGDERRCNRDGPSSGALLPVRRIRGN